MSGPTAMVLDLDEQLSDTLPLFIGAILAATALREPEQLPVRAGQVRGAVRAGQGRRRGDLNSRWA